MPALGPPSPHLGHPWSSKFSQQEWGWGWTPTGFFLLVLPLSPEPWLEGLWQGCIRVFRDS